LFSDQLAGGLAAIRSIAGDQVIYEGDAGQAIVSAVLGATRYEAEDANGVSVTAIATDFLVAVAELVIDGQPVTPAPGHRITRGAEVYELMMLGDEPCFRFSDPGHTQYRLHTKQVSP
jgi:hypothetical protein